MYLVVQLYCMGIIVYGHKVIRKSGCPCLARLPLKRDRICTAASMHILRSAMLRFFDYRVLPVAHVGTSPAKSSCSMGLPDNVQLGELFAAGRVGMWPRTLYLRTQQKFGRGRGVVRSLKTDVSQRLSRSFFLPKGEWSWGKAVLRLSRDVVRTFGKCLV